MRLPPIKPPAPVTQMRSSVCSFAPFPFERSFSVESPFKAPVCMQAKRTMIKQPMSVAPGGHGCYTLEQTD